MGVSGSGCGFFCCRLLGVVYCGCVRKWVWFCFAVGYMFYSISRYCP